MIAPLDWQKGSTEIRASIGAALSHPEVESRVLGQNPRRTLMRVAGPQDTDHLLKLYRLRRGPHRWRDGLKARIGRAAHQREWRALCGLEAKGIRVPSPLGLATTAGGHSLVVSQFVEGESLDALLVERSWGRREDLLSLADSVRALHAAGFIHGDLHPGNVIMGSEGPVLIDWQRAGRRRRGSRKWLRDLARLDFSLATYGVTRSERLRLLCRVLSPEGRNSRSVRTKLRSVARASRRLARRHRRRREREAASRDARAVEDQPSSGKAAHSPPPTRSYSDLFMVSRRSTKAR